MADNNTFRVGLTPDWGDRLESTLRPGLQEVFDPVPNLEFEVFEAHDDMTARLDVIDQYDAIVAAGYHFPKESLDGLKRLKCLARWGVGYDRIDAAACTANDVFIAITPTMIRRTVSEAQLALIFAVAKNIRRLDKSTREGRWDEGLKVQSVCILNRTLGSIGLGNIGGELFRMAQGLHFGRLIAHDPYCSEERAKELGVELVDFDTVMSESDFICINTPLTDATRGMVDRRALSLMKPSAYLINTSRGPVVDEKALIEFLQQERIAGAGLDVFEQEPPEPDNPLFELDNCVVTPHKIALTEEGVRDNTLECLHNIMQIYRGKAPLHYANREVADKPSMQAKLQAGKKG